MGGVLRRAARSLSLPAGVGLFALGLLASGCPFSTFSVGDSPSPSGGAGGARGGSPPVTTGGTQKADGGAPADVAAPHVQLDRYFVRQGQTLQVGPEAGVLANDSPPGLVVFDVEEAPNPWPERYRSDPPEIDARGALTFTPNAAFAGVYRLNYRVRNARGETASARVDIHVLPADLDLGVLTDGVAGVVLEGERGDGLGSAVVPAGDVNSDGFDDLWIGAPGTDGGAGAAYLVFGSSAFPALSLSPNAAARGDAPFLAVTGAPGERAGAAVAALRAETGQTIELVIGAPGGPGRVEFLRVAQLPSSGKIELDPGLHFALLGDDRESGVGRMLAPALDADGDLRPDLLVASQRGDVGALRLVYGKDTGGASRPIADDPGQVLLGSAPDDGFPLSFAGIGDTDHDGNSEVLAATSTNLLLLAGGTRYPPSENDVSLDGSAYGWRASRVAPGTPSTVACVGDLDGDDAPEFAYCEGALASGTGAPGERACRVVLSPPSTLANGFRVTGFSSTATRITVAAAGDHDADGVPDLAFAEESDVYVVYGQRALHRDVILTTPLGAGFRLRLPRGGRLSVVTDAGDVNGDGASDLAISDAGDGSRPGRVYVLFGMAAR